jgi:large subunit ribosomal protein L9
MKLILTQEVNGLGAPGDIVEVKDGYGRNFLVPRGFAIRWTKGGERTVESIKAARSSREVRDLDHAGEIKSKLEGTTFNLPVRAGAGGRLFGAVTVSDIAAVINAESGTGSHPIDKRKIIVGNPIKSLGSHQVTVKLHDEVDATVNLNVVSASA